MAGVKKFLDRFPSDRVPNILMYWIDSEQSAESVGEFAEPLYSAINLFLFTIKHDAARDENGKVSSCGVILD